jgi:hypothetical protein
MYLVALWAADFGFRLPTLNLGGPSDVSSKTEGFHVVSESTVGKERAAKTTRSGVRRVWDAGGGPQAMVLNPGRTERDEAQSLRKEIGLNGFTAPN